MKRYQVTVPIAGHVIKEVNAANAKEAIEMAFNSDDPHEEVQWEMLSRFCQGNVCHCPSPWEPVAEEIGEAE